MKNEYIMEVEKTIRTFNVGIADDHLLFADGIAQLIGKHNQLQLQFIVSNSDDLFTAINRQCPDMLMLDVRFGPLDGIEILKRIRSQKLPIKVIMLSMFQPSDLGIQPDQFEGDGYVLKTSGKEILEEAIQTVLSGNRYLDPHIDAKKIHADVVKGKMSLTRREQEICSLIASGKSSKEIGEILNISELTVKTHRKNIAFKLDSKGMVDLVSKTIRFTQSP